MAKIPTLLAEDADLFYQLWIPLLEFTNQKYHVIDPDVHFIYQGLMVREETIEVSRSIWANPVIIDDYLEQTKLPTEHEDIVRSWKKCISGMFIIERHLKSGSVFISGKNDVYMVKGLVSKYEEMVPNLPVVVNAALLPFRDVIITDGLIVEYPIPLPPEVSNCFKAIYMQAKNRQKIHFSL